MRILIVGGPKTGKTTLSKTLGEKLGITPRHTDDLIGALDWSAASLAVSGWIAEPGDCVIEGVSVVRALRKWLAAYPGSPADKIIYLGQPHQELLPGQQSMTKGVATVWREILPELIARGVVIEFDSEA